MTTDNKTTKNRRPAKSRCVSAARNTAGRDSPSGPRFAVALCAFAACCTFAAFWFLAESSAIAPELIDVARLTLAVAYASLRGVEKRKRLRPA